MTLIKMKTKSKIAKRIQRSVRGHQAVLFLLVHVGLGFSLIRYLSRYV